MALGHVYALLGAIVFLATMVLAPYPLVTIRASEMLGDILNVPCGEAWLLGSDDVSLAFSISISTAGCIIGSFLG